MGCVERPQRIDPPSNPRQQFAGDIQTRIALGEKILPEPFGQDSLLRRSQENRLVREYRQKAEAKTRQRGELISAEELLREDIAEVTRLLEIGRHNQQTDQLARRLKLLEAALAEITPDAHTENQLIIRDAYNVDRQLPAPAVGHGYKDFRLGNESILRLRVLHPDRPEHITGADIVYERHHQFSDKVTILAVQYKIWEDGALPLGDKRLQKQLARMKAFLCDRSLCVPGPSDQTYRFPFCSAFLRPTDRLQTPDQKLMSSGEHLPICRIDTVKSTNRLGHDELRYDCIRDTSLSHTVFEGLFTKGKLGSRTLSRAELESLYRDFKVISDNDCVLIHAQEFADSETETLE